MKGTMKKLFLTTDEIEKLKVAAKRDEEAVEQIYSAVKACIPLEMEFVNSFKNSLCTKYGFNENKSEICIDTESSSNGRPYLIEE